MHALAQIDRHQIAVKHGNRPKYEHIEGLVGGEDETVRDLEGIVFILDLFLVVGEGIILQLIQFGGKGLKGRRCQGKAQQSRRPGSRPVTLRPLLHTKHLDHYSVPETVIAAQSPVTVPLTVPSHSDAAGLRANCPKGCVLSRQTPSKRLPNPQQSSFDRPPGLQKTTDDC